MKKFLLIIGITLLPFLNFAQLTSPNIVSYPCFLAPGVTGTVVADSVPGATYYEWVSNIGHINAVWFPSSPGPVQTAIPSVNILANLALPVYEICVRAINATDTSVWTCVQIMGTVDPPVMLATNSSVGIPGDSGYYAIVYPSLCPPNGYSWTITGDATFNNNSQSIGTNGPGVNINFGPNFTSGLLCIAAVTNFGLYSDTVCMVITAPVGIEESATTHTEIFYQPGSGKIIVKSHASSSGIFICRVIDITGRIMHAEGLNVQTGSNEFTIETGKINEGIYFLELSGNEFNCSYKFFKID